MSWLMYSSLKYRQMNEKKIMAALFTVSVWWWWERNKIKGKKSLFTFTAVRKRNFVSFLLTTAVVVWGENDHDAICRTEVRTPPPSLCFLTSLKDTIQSSILDFNFNICSWKISWDFPKFRWGLHIYILITKLPSFCRSYSFSTAFGRPLFLYLCCSAVTSHYSHTKAIFRNFCPKITVSIFYSNVHNFVTYIEDSTIVRSS